jgi:hypothetical protein
MRRRTELEWFVLPSPIRLRSEGCTIIVSTWINGEEIEVTRAEVDILTGMIDDTVYEIPAAESTSTANSRAPRSESA